MNRTINVTGRCVLVTLLEPREKIWGVLLSLRPEGIWIHGIDLVSFDDWIRQVIEPSEQFGIIGMSTLFFPMHRVERIAMDEPAGSAASLSEHFRHRVGKDILEWIDWGQLESIFKEE